jgi:hypothetical protein
MHAGLFVVYHHQDLSARRVVARRAIARHFSRVLRELRAEEKFALMWVCMWLLDVRR